MRNHPFAYHSGRMEIRTNVSISLRSGDDKEFSEAELENIADTVVEQLMCGYETVELDEVYQEDNYVELSISAREVRNFTYDPGSRYEPPYTEIEDRIDSSDIANAISLDGFIVSRVSIDVVSENKVA